MRTYSGSLDRTFEFYLPNGDVGNVEFNIEFSYNPGTRRSHPGGHWVSSIGTWDPPDDPEWEIGEVTRQDDGKWVVVTPADWFWNAWVIPLWDSLGEIDFSDAVAA